MFICKICDKKFLSQQCLTNHIKKDVCKVVFTCKYCEKEYSSESNMYRHMRSYCSIKEQYDNNKTGIYERLKKLQLENENKNEKIRKLENEKIRKLENKNEKIKQLEKKIKQLEKENIKIKKNEFIKQSKNTINVKGDLNNNINNNIINNITLVGYGKEDITKIDKNDMLKIMKNGFKSSIKLTEALHFNPNYPEYHNIYLSNMKDKYAMFYNGTQWQMTTKESLIDMIYDDKRNYIEDNLEKFIESLTVSQKKALDRWLDTDEDDKKIKTIKEEIKLLLYNSRNLIQKETIK